MQFRSSKPWKMPWARRHVLARHANVLLDSPGFSAVIVASNGAMARMNTVQELLEKYLPQLSDN